MRCTSAQGSLFRFMTGCYSPLRGRKYVGKPNHSCQVENHRQLESEWSDDDDACGHQVGSNQAEMFEVDTLHGAKEMPDVKAR